MKKINKLIVALTLLTLILVGGISGQEERSVVLIVNAGGNVWPDCGLRERLDRSLSDRSGLLLVSPDQTDDLYRRLDGRFNRDNLLSQGKADDYRYIVWCDVLKQQLTIEDGFSLPLFFKQKRVRAELEMEYHILDCGRGRSVGSDRIVLHRNGPANLQCLDYTDADPNLLLTYTEKKELFDRLEQSAAKKLLAAFDVVVRQR